MKLRTAVNQYIAHRRSFGAGFRADGATLNTFVRAIGEEADLADVKTESISKYLAGTAATITATWHRKHRTLRGFYRYVISRGYTQNSPLPVVIPKQPASFVPYIYNTRELRALFGACLGYQKKKSIYDPYMVRTLLLLLYGAGLRLSEAISLTLADVELNNSLITIRETKFHKTRLVPIGKQLTQILLQYVAWRQREKYSLNPNASFFADRKGKTINKNTIEGAFNRIRKRAGVRRTDRGRFQPRLHDLRHTFAVHRLTAWYKQGADVQRLLPVLSVYMGHVCISSTSTYLTMTPTLLEEAGRRFEQYAFKEVSHD